MLMKKYIYINVDQCICFHIYAINVQMKKRKEMKCGFLDFKLC